MSLPIEEKFDTYAGYRSALLDLFGNAAAEIVLFDPDLRQTGLESTAGIEVVSRFLGASRNNRLRIVLHDSGYFERDCPRLRKLFRIYSHVMVFKQTPDDLRHLTEIYAVADKSRLVVRFHCDHARGKAVIGEGADIDAWKRHFESLWEASLDAIAVGRLGL